MNPKKMALMLLLSFTLGSLSISAHAEETAKSPSSSPNEVIMHLVEAKSEIMYHDFMPPSEHIKAARAAAKQVTGNPDIVKMGYTSILQAQIKASRGDKQGAAADLDKALELYKSLSLKAE